MPNKVWDEIIYPIPTSMSVWMDNFIKLYNKFIYNMGLKLICVNKVNPRSKCILVALFITYLQLIVYGLDNITSICRHLITQELNTLPRYIVMQKLNKYKDIFLCYFNINTFSNSLYSDSSSNIKHIWGKHKHCVVNCFSFHADSIVLLGFKLLLHSSMKEV